jgi:hypothetical protein
LALIIGQGFHRTDDLNVQMTTFALAQQRVSATLEK